ncbi:hypothetical protein [Streptomyces zhihengii]|uniref:hypothetical protein n=1 Tax=Streptomyces zhihengii TaxID=1818004 RepID=UPI00339E316B
MEPEVALLARSTGTTSAFQELRALLDHLDPQGSAAMQTSQHASASGQGRVYQAGRDQHITER